MGLIAYIYRSADGLDCTLHGWSSRFTQVTVVNAEGPFDPTADRPSVMVLRHPTMNTLHAVLTEHMYAGKWTTMGGNFLHASDSRFGDLCRKLLTECKNGIVSPLHWSVGAVPIHDRIEG